MLREIVLDTETTGLDPNSGHRIIEIGCIELINHLPSGREFQVYINPERDVPAEASAISGIFTDFLLDKPLFIDVVDDFLSFIEDSPLIIHNASFDLKFLNFELKRVEKSPILPSRSTDTLFMARRKFPGSPANLDALCSRFNIDTSSRVKHGAVIDCRLLAEVYLNLIGGRQTKLDFLAELTSNKPTLKATTKTVKPARPHEASEEELIAHKKFVDGIKNSIWQSYTK